MEDQETETDKFHDIIIRLKAQNTRLENEVVSVKSTLIAINRRDRTPKKAHMTQTENHYEIIKPLQKIKNIKRQIGNLKLVLLSQSEDKVGKLKQTLAQERKRYQEVKSENKSLVSIRDEQSRSIKGFAIGNNFVEKARTISQQVRDMKFQNNLLRTKLQSHESASKEKHQTMVQLDRQIRKAKSQKNLGTKTVPLDNGLNQMEKYRKVASHAKLSSKQVSKNRKIEAVHRINEEMEAIREIQWRIAIQDQYNRNQEEEIRTMQTKIRKLQRAKSRLGPKLSITFNNDVIPDQRSRSALRNKLSKSSSVTRHSSVQPRNKMLARQTYSKPNLVLK